MSVSGEDRKTRYIMYAGGQDMWREWSIKTKAYGGKQGWAKALTRDMTHKEVAEGDLSEAQLTEQGLNKDAWNHLVLACTKSVFNLITTATVYENAYAT